jgi:hypothetical protein
MWARAGPGGMGLQFQRFLMRAGKMAARRIKKSRKRMVSPHSEAASIRDRGRGRILRKSAAKLIMSHGSIMGRLSLVLLMINSLAE